MNHLIDLIQKILNSPNERNENIEKFQNEAFDLSLDGLSKDQLDLAEVIKGLAYDFEFYRESEELRQNENLFYGDDKLELLVKVALVKLNRNS
ncbi:MAG: hypothetical protein SGI89_07245 [bacterium]|nr:hypothetical protein [bacterium]